MPLKIMGTHYNVFRPRKGPETLRAGAGYGLRPSGVHQIAKFVQLVENTIESFLGVFTKRFADVATANRSNWISGSRAVNLRGIGQCALPMYGVGHGSPRRELLPYPGLCVDTLYTL